LPSGMDPDDLAKNYKLSLLDETILHMIELGRNELIIRRENG